ncbi:MAG: STAS domain-containing protein [Bryobacteraceae bacterium]|nr:STAS domain-containing protein [Bryobacteraceae bacterium]
MSLEIQQREREGILVFDLKGRLTVGEGVTRLRETLTKAASSGRVNAVLNLEQLDYIDSTGLGSLVICYTTMKKAGGALKLVNVNRRNIELLVLTKLTTVFELYTSEQDAINSFFPDREIRRFDILSFVQSQRQKSEGE